MLRAPTFFTTPYTYILTCLRAQAGLIDGVSAAADQNAAGACGAKRGAPAPSVESDQTREL